MVDIDQVGDRNGVGFVLAGDGGTGNTVTLAGASTIDSNGTDTGSHSASNAATTTSTSCGHRQPVRGFNTILGSIGGVDNGITCASQDGNTPRCRSASIRWAEELPRRATQHGQRHPDG